MHPVQVLLRQVVACMGSHSDAAESCSCRMWGPLLQQHLDLLCKQKMQCDPDHLEKLVLIWFQAQVSPVKLLVLHTPDQRPLRSKQ